MKLRDAMTLAAEALRLMDGGASLEAALVATGKGLAGEERAALQSVLYSAARKRAAARSLLSLLAPKTPEERVGSLLLVALSLLMEDPEKSYVTVSESVEALKGTPATRRAAGFANAVLRRFMREREELLLRIADDPEVRFNAPLWWVQRLTRELGAKESARVMMLSQKKPPLTLRVNAAKTTVAEWSSRARAADFSVTQVSGSGVILSPAAPVARIPGFAEGLVSVQDAGAQLAARMLSPREGERILDACAAPGGKTAHLLEISKARVTALEVDSQRAERIRENLTRLGLTGCEVRVADAGDTSAWWDGTPFDSILLDAPCTASGIVRRHPDIPFSRREEDIAALSRQQERLLEALWPLVKLGGKLLYVVCSVFEAEGKAQIDAFLARHPDCRIAPAPAGGLPARFALLPQEQDAQEGFPLVHDGFYYALLSKQAEVFRA